MALSALSGCVTVQRPPMTGPAAAVPSPPSAHGPEGQAKTPVVQAPAREALERVGPSRRPAATTLKQRQRQQPAAGAAPAERPPSSGSHPHRHRPQPRPAHPEPRRHAPPHVDIPDVEAEVRRTTDVCALGRKYGGWRGDSPESVICDQAYGRR
ncbi:hypothetical protein ACFY30_32965 [Streptomyces sp. NPDC000345]|uniref:hypothetical protein n=1 Tax=Streptomyces sp. NPDC000345 TaxID=3364537 RepID=UPI0036C4B9BA